MTISNLSVLNGLRQYYEFGGFESTNGVPKQAWDDLNSLLITQGEFELALCNSMNSEYVSKFWRNFVKYKFITGLHSTDDGTEAYLMVRYAKEKLEISKMVKLEESDELHRQ